MTTYERVRTTIYAILPLLVFYGVITDEAAALWGAAIYSALSALLAVWHVPNGVDRIRLQDLDE